MELRDPLNLLVLSEKGGGRIKKTFRYSVEVVRQLEEIAKALDTTETEASAEAIRAYYQSLKGEKDTIPLSEYKALQEKVESLQRTIGELEGRLREKDHVIKVMEKALSTKEGLIESLRENLRYRDRENIELQKKLADLKEQLKKPWWKFW